MCRLFVKDVRAGRGIVSFEIATKALTINDAFERETSRLLLLNQIVV